MTANRALIHHEKLHKNQEGSEPMPLRVVTKSPVINPLQEQISRNNLEIRMLKESNGSLKSYNEKLRTELDEAKEKLFHVENILASIQNN